MRALRCHCRQHMEAEDYEALFAFVRDHLIRVEVIGHERPFGAEPSEEIKSRFYSKSLHARR